jgi:hypothetical protein
MAFGFKHSDALIALAMLALAATSRTSRVEVTHGCVRRAA